MLMLSPMSSTLGAEALRGSGGAPHAAAASAPAGAPGDGGRAGGCCAASRSLAGCAAPKLKSALRMEKETESPVYSRPSLVQWTPPLSCSVQRL